MRLRIQATAAGALAGLAYLCCSAFLDQAHAFPNSLGSSVFDHLGPFIPVNGFVGEIRPVRAPLDEPCASSIGRVRGVMTGTGAVALHRRLVLTNAHVVAKDGVVQDRVESLLPDWGGFQAYMGTVVSLGTKDLRETYEHRKDWAIIVLDTAVPVKPLSLGFPMARDIDKLRSNLFVVSYSHFRRTLPGSGVQFPVVSRSCGIQSEKAGMFSHNCSTSPGGSGAPLLKRDPDGSCTIMALHRGAPHVESDLEELVFSDATANEAILPLFFKDEIMRILKALEGGRPISEMKAKR